MEMGYRDPMTYRKEHPGYIGSISCHVINLNNLAKQFRNVELHQYIHELIQGKDPRYSEWFENVLL